ncbi:MAG: hypothetical protein H0X38_00305 [Planctomycetes bacterium]|nr:hypothetical protein [Planctomycetota bacterium]
MSDLRLSVLVSHHLDGQLPPDEQAELEDVLRRSAGARVQYWREAALHALLHEVENAGALAMPRACLALPRRRRAIAALAAAACVAFSAGAALWSWHGGGAPAPVERTTTAIAVLSRVLDAQWAAPADTHIQGEALAPGWLHLRSGIAQIEFYNGVRLVCAGPIDVHLLSGKEAVLDAGRLSAEVPRLARGFAIHTPRLTVVDLGTAFGLAVDGVHEEVHVFTGRVTLQTASGPVQELHADQAMGVVGDGAPQAMHADRSAFPSAADLERKSIAAQDQIMQAWNQAAAKLDADPALVLHFDFEKESVADRTLRNRAAHGGEVGDATIVGCAAAEGRWRGKQALEFRDQSDRVRASVPGELGAASLVAWVRVDALDHPFNSLFMTDGFAAGALHWQIRGNGSLHMAVSGPAGAPAAQYNFDSPGVFAAARLKRWTQVAMVYDGARLQLTQYVDGQAAGRFPLQGGMALRIGHGELGNWNPASSSDTSPVRNLTGRIDEFAFFSRALSDAEVGDLYRSGSTGIPGDGR